MQPVHMPWALVDKPTGAQQQHSMARPAGTRTNTRPAQTIQSPHRARMKPVVAIQPPPLRQHDASAGT